jgi:hypothetical protein
VKGQIVRLLFHDPYGDLTQHPLDDGYYDPLMYTDETAYHKPDHKHEVDKDDGAGAGDKGAYAPYHHDVHAWGGTIEGRYLTALWRSDQPRSRDMVKDRLLAGDPK